MEVITKKKGHIATACKALEKQIEKNNIEAQKHLTKAEEHQKMAQFFLDQNSALSEQIKKLES